MIEVYKILRGFEGTEEVGPKHFPKKGGSYKRA